jgi:hypothetical protein
MVISFIFITLTRQIIFLSSTTGEEFLLTDFSRGDMPGERRLFSSDYPEEDMVIFSAFLENDIFF